MAKTFITPQEGAELQRLYGESLRAHRRVIAAMQTGVLPMEGATLARLRAEREKEAAIFHRIDEILHQ